MPVLLVSRCMLISLLATAFLLSSISGNSEEKPISATQLTERLARMDLSRAATLQRYTAMRRYVLNNERFHTHAEMTVRMTYTAPGKKEFEVVSESGSVWIRKHVFWKLLQAEKDGTRADARNQTRITPENYDFKLLTAEKQNGRPCYVFDVVPKRNNKYLFRGRVWVDTEDAAVARIEGSPAQKPSFWTTSVHFVHRYEKFGPYWLATSNVSETEVRLFGRTDLKVDYFDYSIE